MNYCTNCGTKLKDNARFCEHCGTAVANQNMNRQNTPIQQTTNIQQPKKMTTGKLLLIILGIIGAGVVGLIALSVFIVLSLSNALEEIKEANEPWTYEEQAKEKLIIEDLSIEYSNLNWTKLETIATDNLEAIVKDKSTITISKLTTDVPITKENEIKIIEDTQEKLGNKKYAENEETYINGKNWTKITYFGTTDNTININIVYAERNNVYVFSYLAPSNVYAAEQREIQSIYNSLDIKH